MEFIQEVQIKSSGFEAEYGGGSGVINVIQKTGSNAWHGSMVAYYRSDGLNANDQCLWFATCGLRTNPTIGVELFAPGRLASGPGHHEEGPLPRGRSRFRDRRPDFEG